MEALHYIGAGIVFIIITIVGLYSGRKVKTADDFATGGKKAGVGIVAGSIIGTLVGGASTIGTAQLAFSYGFSAWWFTLGSGIGCLVLGVFFVKPLYSSGVRTLPQVVSREYGHISGTVMTVLTSVGSFLSIVSQILSGIALATSISSVSPIVSSLLIIFLMLVYVVFGGVWGAGLVGALKTVLLYCAVCICGIIAIYSQGGVSAFYHGLPVSQYFNLLARGPIVDLGAGISLILGILTTQVYIQAFLFARTLKISYAGVFISAFVIPLVGIAGIFIGLYMRLNHPEIVPGSALPLFVIEKTPPLAAGMILATLLIALVGTGAGVALGMASMIFNDIYLVYFNKKTDDRTILRFSRFIIILILLAAAFFSTGNIGSLILDWSFMSMGLRGVVAFGPLCTALFLPGRISSSCVVTSMILGPILVLVGKLILPPDIDPVLLGLAGALLVLLFGLARSNTRSEA